MKSSKQNMAEFVDALMGNTGEKVCENIRMAFNSTMKLGKLKIVVLYNLGKRNSNLNNTDKLFPNEYKMPQNSFNKN
jgi:hypothetical protein